MGFLVRISPQGEADRYQLRDTPAYTNQSREPRLDGWCGSWNNTSTSGMGIVEKVARNGRALVRLLDGPELLAALEELGYPELAPANVHMEEG